MLSEFCFQLSQICVTIALHFQLHCGFLAARFTTQVPCKEASHLCWRICIGNCTRILFPTVSDLCNNSIAFRVHCWRVDCSLNCLSCHIGCVRPILSKYHILQNAPLSTCTVGFLTAWFTRCKCHTDRLRFCWRICNGNVTGLFLSTVTQIWITQLRFSYISQELDSNHHMMKNSAFWISVVSL